MEQVLAEAGHDLAEGTKAKLKAALLTKTLRRRLAQTPFWGVLIAGSHFRRSWQELPQVPRFGRQRTGQPEAPQPLRELLL